MFRTFAFVGVLSVLAVSHLATAAVDDKPVVEESAVPDEEGSQRLLAPVLQPDRGQMLYENHCLTCHESVVHIRENQRARSFAQVTGWVVRWASGLQLDWRAEEIEDVVRYLNRRFYNYIPYPEEQ